MTNRKDLCRLANALGGLPVLGCHPDSPAQRAGVRYGDVLLSVNGRPTPDWTAFIEARAANPRAMEIEVFRDGVTLQLSVALNASLDPAEVLAEILAERLVPLDYPEIAEATASKPN